MIAFRSRVAAGAAAVLAVLAACAPAAAQSDGAALYQRNCASCHGAHRQGTGLGPALAQRTYRYGGTREDLARIIANGMVSRGMPAFGDTLSAGEIAAIAAFLPARQGEPQPDPEELQAAANAAPREFDAVPGVVDTLDYAVRAEVFADGLETVWALAFLDADTALVSERPGRLRVIRNGVLDPRPVRGTPQVHVSAHPWNQGGLLDIALDPDHRENGWIYLSYSHRLEAAGAEGEVPAMTRVVRGRIRDHAWVDQQVVFEAEPAAYEGKFWHYGGRMAFDREGRLYFSIGDRGVQELAREPGRPTGKIHRLMPDGSVPPANPLRGREGALASIYSLGHRNPQGMAREPATGRIWATEHGPRGGDELNIIEAGADYGWPVVTHGINYDGTPITPETRAAGVAQPVYYWRPSIGVSGLSFYDGSQFPLWRGKLLVTGLAPRELRLLTLDGGRVQHEEVVFRAEGRPYEPVVGPDGAVYLVTDDPGRIVRLTAQRERRL
ncbi:PQQ-dependent sugar dehydrogenase [Luteimonas sp. RD2P54]|uniref:PQQ-dependent sugar dehydrogenase n=1 Tax=Luteimonas endophytica TaxID=3042023 RepID=A0ABT6JBR6_9GAMM|nr:PQQ-dependent sugar dehydrogenase [Luteimonas endophytica]MDH5823633.1 PQQ-dependent sugar dehydrogenase [Luteimonas endophytica]